MWWQAGTARGRHSGDRAKAIGYLRCVDAGCGKVLRAGGNPAARGRWSTKRQGICGYCGIVAVVIVIKTPDEIERMRAACNAAAETLAAVAREVQPGRTTAELNDVAAELIAKVGGKSPFLGYK